MCLSTNSLLIEERFRITYCHLLDSHFESNDLVRASLGFINTFPEIITLYGGELSAALT